MKIHHFVLPLLSLATQAETNKELLARLVKNESHGKVTQVFNLPSYQTSISMEYDFDEIKVKPKEVLYFEVPEALSVNPLSQIGFSHRQIGYKSERDYSPGLTSALVYSSDIVGDELRYWAGHGSGKLGAKFAEYRESPEFDSLFEWPRSGHKGIGSKDTDKTLIHANAVRIQNVGSDDIYFSKLYLETLPTKAEKYQDVIFTPESNFGDPETMKGRYYGGGQNKRGTFPGALRLTAKGHKHQPKLPDNMQVDENRLYIQLPTGSNLSSIEVMCGDTHPDQVKNKDGGWGSLGSASLSIYVYNSVSGETRMLLKKKNVGPQGVITTADVSSSTKLKDGDHIVIENKYKGSTAYIMALRLGYNL